MEAEINQTQSQYEHNQDPSNEDRSWWLDRPPDNTAYTDYSYYNNQIPLGDRASPDGLEMPKDDEGRKSPYDNVPIPPNIVKRPKQLPLFISRHTNIDDILGGTPQIWSPLANKMYDYQDEGCTEVDATQVIIHEATPQRTLMHANRM